MVGKIDAFLLKGIKIGHIILCQQPGIRRFQHHHQQIFILEKPGFPVVRAHLPAFVLSVQLVGALVALPNAEGHREIPESVLIEAGQHNAAVCVGKFRIDFRLRVGVIGIAPSHGV